MRRTLPAILITALLLAACGSDDDAQSTGDSAPAGSDSSVATSDSVTDSAPAPTNPDKPTVDIPDEIPTELQITVLEEGEGPESAEGDTVVVDYVGVRSSDGVEFDNSYDRFQPFNVVVGSGAVIEGWDQGLVGVQAGSTVQLDIPSDLAYGETARGDIIGENEALTFLVEVRAVIPPADPADEPTEPGVDLSEDADEPIIVDLREGDGTELQAGQTAIIRYVLFRGDNGVVLESSWAAETFPFTLEEGAFPVLVDGLEGMKVGGRRAITFPPEYPDFGFGPEGNPTGGLPADTDAIIVADLLGVFGTPS